MCLNIIFSVIVSILFPFIIISAQQIPERYAIDLTGQIVIAIGNPANFGMMMVADLISKCIHSLDQILRIFAFFSGMLYDPTGYKHPILRETEFSHLAVVCSAAHLDDMYGTGHRPAAHEIMKKNKSVAGILLCGIDTWIVTTHLHSRME